MTVIISCVNLNGALSNVIPPGAIVSLMRFVEYTDIETKSKVNMEDVSFRINHNVPVMTIFELK